MPAVRSWISNFISTCFDYSIWSPDSKRLAFEDNGRNLWVIDLDTGETSKIDEEPIYNAGAFGGMDPVWSPDSKWIAYTKRLDNRFNAVYVYGVESGSRHAVTDGLSDSRSPAWDAGGKHLCFLASTDYGLNVGWLDMSSYNRPRNYAVYVAVLDADLTLGLPPVVTAMTGVDAMVHAIEAYTDSLAAEMEPLGVHVSVIEPGNYNSAIAITALNRMRAKKDEYAKQGSPFAEPFAEWIERDWDRSVYKDPDEVAEAAVHAMFAEEPLRRYMVVPREEEAGWTIGKQIEELVQLNEWQEYSYTRDELVQMLDAALAGGDEGE